MSVTKVYRRSVAWIDPSCSVREAAETMRRSHVGSLVVAEDAGGGRQRPLGVLTDRDIVVEVIAAGVDPGAVTAAEVMRGELVTVALDDDLLLTVKLLRRHRVRRLPVVDGQGLLAGILSLDDVLGTLAEMLSDLADLIRSEQDQEWQTRS